MASSKFLAADAELSALEERAMQPGDAQALAAAVALAWHLRQRDSARALRLVDGVLPLLAPQSEDAPRPDAHRVRAALAACEASALLCDFDVAERWLAQARRHLDAEADPAAEGDAWLVEAVLAQVRVQREREMAAHLQAIDVYGRIDAPERLAIARIWLCFERAYTEPDVDHAAGIAPPGPRWPEAGIAWDALWSATRGVAASYRRTAEAVRMYLHAAARARGVGLVRLEIITLINAGAAAQTLGDLDQAAERYEAAADRAAATGWPTLIGAANTRIGILLQTVGAFEESHRILADAIVALSIGAPGLHLASASFSLAEALRQMGRAEESLEPMARSIALFRRLGRRHSLAAGLVAQARGLAAVARPQSAQAVLHEARDLIGDGDLHSLRADVAEALAELHHQFELPAPEGMTLPTAALHYAEAALAEGARVPGRKTSSRLRTFLAERWAEAGDHARAYRHAREALLAKAEEGRQKLTFSPMLARPRGRAAAAVARAGSPGRPRRSGSQTLTPKERSILLLVARNFSNKEIARQIEVSDETVKWHLKNLFGKLEASSRKEAVARARSLGFITFSG